MSVSTKVEKMRKKSTHEKWGQLSMQKNVTHTQRVRERTGRVHSSASKQASQPKDTENKLQSGRESERVRGGGKRTRLPLGGRNAGHGRRDRR